MKKTAWKRAISLLLTLCLLLALFAGLTLVSADSYVRNWGVRNDICTELSPDALAYYTGTNTYAQLKALPGAADTTNSLYAAVGNDLYDALYTLMSSTQTGSVSYTNHMTWYAYTDCENGDTSGNMKLLWAGGYRTWDGSFVNREHVWCKSRATYVEDDGGADLHHLRPASAWINQQPHNNKPYGTAQGLSGATQVFDEVGNFGGWCTGSVFEPADNVKGDCARILLYVYTRWKQPNLYTAQQTSSVAYNNFILGPVEGNCDGSACIESLNTLLQWCAEDPVDTWEMGRNDAAQSFQGNRNVFIDYPELAWYMFGLTPPADMLTPSGDAVTGNSPYHVISAAVNDPALGTATVVNNYTVSVSLAPGCYIDSAVASSGTAIVSGSHVFVTGMTADATVSITLAQNTPRTISFAVPNGVTQPSPVIGYVNSSVTLPTPTGNPTANAHAYSFAGWVSGTVNDTQTAPVFYPAGAAYPVTGNETLTALYTYDEYVGGAGVQSLMQMTAGDTLQDGDELVIVAHGTSVALYQETRGTTYVEKYTFDGDLNTVLADDKNHLTVTVIDASFCLGDSTNGYLYNPSSNNLKLAGTPTMWTLEDPEDGTFKLIGDGNRYLSFRSDLANSGNDYWRMGGANLGTSGQTVLDLYKIDTDTGYRTFYTTVLQSSSVPCDHSNHSLQNAVAAGCLADGYTGDDVCDDCGAVLAYGTVIPAPGQHSYAAVSSTAATCTATGTTIYTCSACGDTYTVTDPMLPHSEDSGTVTTQPTCLAAGVMTYTCTVCHTVTRTEAIPALGHDYVSSVTTQPTCTAPGVRTYECSRCHGTYTESIPALGGDHVFDAGVITTQPTCTSDGVRTYTCQTCGETQTAAEPALGHDYHDSVTTPATCGTAGIRTYACSRCSDSYTESIAPTGNHTYDNGVITTQPTCTDDGVKTFTCTVCHATTTGAVPALGHNLINCVSNHDKTHTGTCTRCNMQAIGSCNFSEISHTSLITKYRCDDCGYTYSKLNRPIIVIIADCKYREEFECAVSFRLEKRSGVTVESTPYNFIGWVDAPIQQSRVRPDIISLPGDTWYPEQDMTFYALYSYFPGSTYSGVYSTSDLFAGDSIVLAAQGSGLVLSETGSIGTVPISSATGAPACEKATTFSFEPGESRGTWYLRTGERYLAVDAKGQLAQASAVSSDFAVAWKVERIGKEGAAVLSVTRNDGKTLYLNFDKTRGFVLSDSSSSAVTLFKKSGVVYTTDPMGTFCFEHKYEITAKTPATCTEDGEITYTCSVCGDTYTEKIPATGHSFEDGICTVCGAAENAARIDSAYLRLNDNIDVIYTAELPEGFDEAYMTFTMNGVSCRVAPEKADDGSCIFPFTGITPQHMGDSILAELTVVKNGETFTDVRKDYSIRQYCINQLKKTSDDKLKTLLSDLLTYGAAAQCYTNYRTDALVTEGIDLTPSKFEGLKSAKATFEGEKDPAVDWYSSTLALRNALAVRLYFKAEKTDDLTVKTVIGDRAYLFNEKQFACTEAGLYYVEVRGIKATEFDAPVTASFYRSGKQTGRTVTYSVNTYISSMQDVTNEPLQMLVRALYCYGASAKAYAGK